MPVICPAGGGGGGEGLNRNVIATDSTKRIVIQLVYFSEMLTKKHIWHRHNIAFHAL